MTYVGEGLGHKWVTLSIAQTLPYVCEEYFPGKRLFRLQSIKP
jgi:hypothetical protein